MGRVPRVLVLVAVFLDSDVQRLHPALLKPLKLLRIHGLHCSAVHYFMAVVDENRPFRIAGHLESGHLANGRTGQPRGRQPAAQRASG